MKTMLMSKKVCLVVLTSMSLASCLTTEKFNNYVISEYENRRPNAKKTQTEYITVHNNMDTSGNKLATTTERTKILPLLVYWQIDGYYDCTLNSQIPAQIFTKNINANKKLKQKINDNHLELTVTQLPHAFEMKGRSIIVLVYSTSYQTLQTKESPFVVNYKYTPENGEVKTGTITIPYEKDRYLLGMFKGWQRSISEYIDHYDAYVTDMSKRVADQLVKEL